MTVRDRLHQGVDKLPEGTVAETAAILILDELNKLDAAAVEQLLEYVHWLSHQVDALSNHELARVEAGEAEIARGDYVTLEDLHRCIEQ